VVVGRGEVEGRRASEDRGVGGRVTIPAGGSSPTRARSFSTSPTLAIGRSLGAIRRNLSSMGRLLIEIAAVAGLTLPARQDGFEFTDPAHVLISRRNQDGSAHPVEAVARRRLVVFSRKQRQLLPIDRAR